MENTKSLKGKNNLPENDFLEKKLLDFIDSSGKEMIALQSLLTRFPSIAPENGGEGELKNARLFLHG